MAEDVLIRFRADIGQLTSGIESVIKQFEILSTNLKQLGEIRSATSVATIAKKFAQDAKLAQREIDNLITRIEILRSVQSRTRRGQRTVTLSPEEQAGLGGIGGTTRRVDVARLERLEAEATRQIEAKRTALAEQRLQAENIIHRLAAGYPSIHEKVLRQSELRVALEQRVANILSGRAEQRLVEERLQEINRRRQDLLNEQQILRRQAASQAGRRTGGRISREEIQGQAQILRLEQQRLRVDAEIEALQKQISENVGTAKAISANEELNRKLNEQGLIYRKIIEAKTRLEERGGATARIDELTRQLGTAPRLREIDAQLQALRQLEFETLTGGARAFAPGIDKLKTQLEALTRQQKLLVGNEEKQLEIERQRFAILKEIEALQEGAATVGLPKTLSPEEVLQQQEAQLGGFQRLLFRAFDDVGRRFQATLQFAISGAAIFGAQQIVREFAQAAIEVERTFADTASALEFDFAEKGIARGTSRFDRELEAIRRRVLVLANDFNTLPTVANEAAFSMVARFGETEDALKAVRAQLLATKVSTIDQSEAIRALSATAEGFADALLDANNNLTIQERILQRERAAADNYAKALDNAVFLQQRFGVEVEDTLEGTARMSETFRSLGFTMEQTNAIVATVSRTLGQTGVQAAEKLNRSLGQIASPQIRDQLLELARTSKTFTLTLEDFDSGAKAFEAIANQMDRIQQLEPGTASRIISIIGQRRENEVVAALLGSNDLRRAMEISLEAAAGAAERRFGFLAATISEQIQSIVTEFQSLAQNFERLGLLAPLKAVLATVGAALGSLNNLVQLILNAFERLDEIGERFGIRLGSTVKNLLIAAAALKTLAVTVQAVSGVISVGVAAKAAVERVATSAAVGGTAIVAGEGAALSVQLRALAANLKDANGKTVGVIGTLRVFAQALKATTVSLLGRFGAALQSAPVVGGALTRLSSSLGLSAAALGAWTVGIGAATVAIGTFISSMDDAVDALEFRNSLERRANIRLQQQERLEPSASPIQQEIRRIQNEIDDIRNRLNSTEQRGLLATTLSRTFPIFDEATRRNIGPGAAFAESLKSLIPIFKPLDKRLIPNSKEFWDNELKNGRKALLDAQLRSISEQARATRSPEAEGLARRAGELINLLQGDLTEEQLNKVELEFESLSGSLQSFLDSINLSTQKIEETLQGFEADLQNVSSRRTLGQIGPAQGAAEIEAIRKRAEAQLASLQDALARGVQVPDLEDQIKALFDFIATLVGEELSQLQRAFDVQARRIQATVGGDQNQLALKIALIRRELAKVPEGTDRAIDLQIELAQAERDLAQLVSDQAVRAAQARLQLARTSREWFQASERLRKELLRQAGELVAQGRIIEAQEKFNEELAQRNAEFDRFIDELQRRVSVQVRLSSPVESKLARIEADIAATRELIAKGKLDAIPLLEAQLRLNELLAQRARAQAAAAAAATRLQAGVNDSILSLKAELTIVDHELDLTSRLIGEQSEEWFQLKLRQEQLRQQLIDAQLELEDLNRRLASDITDPFQQAQLDLVDIVRKLSQTDLGELERARLELEKKQIEANREREFFNDRLFQLKFRFETGELSLSGYVGALKRLLDTVDTSTRQGKEIFLEIQSLIDGLANDISNLQFNVPTSIRLPTLFEVRRAVAADQLGVNYLDNRTQEIIVNVSNEVDLQDALSIIDSAFGTLVDSGFQRVSTGGAGITLGAF